MTKYTLTREQLTALNPCDLADRLTLFGTLEVMSVTDALNAGASVSDILWVAGAMGFGTKCAEFAIRCAESVAKHNPDPRVQAAIDAAKVCIAEPSGTNKSAAADAAAYAAYAADAARAAAAVYAAYAAYAAAYAADAARAAAAVYAAYAADAARDAAAARTADARAEQKNWLKELFKD